MSITFKFTNRNLNEDGIRVWRSATPFDKDTLPGATHDELVAGTKVYEDTFVARGDEYYYLFETYRGNDSAFSNLIHGKALPILTGPGPQTLSAGDHRLGFYGETLVTDLVDGDALATSLGLTAGTSQFSSEPWLKFNHHGKTLFVAKKPYRHSVSWDHIAAVNAVYGGETDAQFTSDFNDTFRVRLLTGGDADPASSAGGEWNDLIYRVHVDDPTGTNWASYTDTDIVVGTGNGRASWTQETAASNSGYRVSRGASSLTYFSAYTSSTTYSGIGWRPCLELVV